MDQVAIFKALANPTRLEILKWLKAPEIHFPDYVSPSTEGNLGVCVGHIHQKSGLTQSTISEHLSILHRAGLVTATRVGQWTYYTRNEEAIHALSKLVAAQI